MLRAHGRLIVHAPVQGVRVGDELVALEGVPLSSLAKPPLGTGGAVPGAGGGTGSDFRRGMTRLLLLMRSRRRVTWHLRRGTTTVDSCASSGAGTAHGAVEGWVPSSSSSRARRAAAAAAGARGSILTAPPTRAEQQAAWLQQAIERGKLLERRRRQQAVANYSSTV